MRAIKDFIKAFSRGFKEALDEENNINRKEPMHVPITIEVQVPVGDQIVRAIERRRIELKHQGRII